MKIKVKTTFAIVFTSIILSLTYNYFAESGIPLIAEEKKLIWAGDSLQFPADKMNSVENKKPGRPDDIAVNSEDGINKNKIEKNGNQKSIEEKVKEKELTEPKAIHLNQAYELFKRNILFIDAREPEDYKAAHIKNAINIPMDHFDDYKFMLDKINKNQIIVTYCAGSDCDLSIVLSNVLFDSGYRKLYVFFGGWNEWLQAGYPTEKENAQE